jgi:hypothetical protein
MKWLCVAIAAACLVGAGAQERKKKLPDVRVLEVKCVNLQGEVTLDGRVRSNSEKPIEGLILTFDFMASGKKVLSTRRITVDEPVLETGVPCRD